MAMVLASCPARLGRETSPRRVTGEVRLHLGPLARPGDHIANGLPGHGTEHTAVPVHAAQRGLVGDVGRGQPGVPRGYGACGRASS
ncbi:MAG: hypothetical protein M3443_09020, partial [Actinomycetota bacterium]|nr:hypothetical protein [Actinomycetota bacterium]